MGDGHFILTFYGEWYTLKLYMGWGTRPAAVERQPLIFGGVQPIHPGIFFLARTNMG